MENPPSIGRMDPYYWWVLHCERNCI